jgi:hypothetical protein
MSGRTAVSSAATISSSATTVARITIAVVWEWFTETVGARTIMATWGSPVLLNIRR